MAIRFQTRVPVFAIAVVASVGAATFIGSYARAGGLDAAERFVQPFFKTFSGTSAGPIVVTLNNGTGPSLQGTSVKGNGIVGQTKLNNGGFTGATAVIGKDLGTTGAQGNAGVGGTSTEGTGVYGTSTDGAGIYGSSNSSVGVNGISSSSYGVAGTSTSATGVSGGGVVGVSGQGSAQSIVAFGQGGQLFRGVSSGFVDVFDVENDGSLYNGGNLTTSGVVSGNGFGSNTGVTGTGSDYGVFGIGLNNFTNGGAVAAKASEGGNIYVGFNSSFTQVYSLDSGGNIHISGQIFTSGGCSAGCAKTKNGPGRHVVSFTPAESEPTTEDFGAGQLRDGVAYVQIAPDFANTIDRNASYMVFLSPEGDNRGLYITGKTPAGFTVHESQGGHSTLGFSYRIVAKRYGIAQQRLPMVDVAVASRPPWHAPIMSTIGHLVPRPAAIPRPINHR